MDKGLSLSPRPLQPISARPGRGAGGRELRFSSCSPASLNASPDPAVRSLTVWDVSTSDGPAMAPTREPMTTARPPTFPAIVSISPVCNPARTWTPSGRTASTIACAHLTPRAGLSQDVETRHVLRLLRDTPWGVGYLLKNRVGILTEFVDALKEGREWRIGRRSRGRLDAPRPRPRPGPARRLTPRERQVLELMAEGRSNVAIGDRLG